LIEDAALNRKRYSALVLIQGEIVDQPILDKINRFLRSGGTVIQVGEGQVANVEGNVWKPARKIQHVISVDKTDAWLPELGARIRGLNGVDGKLDGVWTCRRGAQVFLYNSKDKPAEVNIGGRTVEVAPFAISEP
jgi:hypothetical protein